MTSDELAFIAALDAEPENHGLRQIYADWLDDRGDPGGGWLSCDGKAGDDAGPSSAMPK